MTRLNAQSDFYRVFNKYVNVSSARCSPHIADQHLHFLIIFAGFYMNFTIYNTANCMF